jgi:hypothetical protein
LPPGQVSFAVRPKEEAALVSRSKFARMLRQGIVAGLRAFRQQHTDETPYAFALLGGTGRDHLGCAVATEEGLLRVAAKYHKRGYRHVLLRSERPATCEELADWLRWANPDDGCHIGGLPEHERVQDELCALVEAGGLGEDGVAFEEFCTDVLASLQDMPAWQREMTKGRVVVGFTYGSNPRDFLRTATRANPFRVVSQLWRETWRAQELGSRLRSS